MQNSSPLSLFSMKTHGQAGLRSFTLLMLCVMVALRAFALPLSMGSHSDLSGQPDTSLASVPKGSAHSAGDCHEDTKPAGQAAHGSASNETAKLCQIMCDIASAPLLMPTQADLASAGFEVMNAAKSVLYLGVTPPPDHPPPIA